MSLLGLERSLADRHQSYPFCPESGVWARLGLPFPAFPLLQAPALSATCAHWHLPRPCLLRAPPGSGLGCEVGESARPAVPFLASSWLLTPFGALISSGVTPAPAPKPVSPPLAGHCLWYDPVYLYTLKAEDKDVFFSPSHTPTLSSYSLLGLVPSPGR